MQIKSKLEKVKNTISEHKAEILAGSITVACTGLALYVGNKYLVSSGFQKFVPEKTSVKEVNKELGNPVTAKIVEVNSFKRNLHEGWKASAENIELARQNGITLHPGQSFIPEHSRRYLSA